MKIKKILCYLFPVWVIILLFSSCSRTEPDLFDKSAAERLNESVENIVDLLCSAENGWVFNYFPNNDTEGYTYIMKFSPYYKVTMAALNKYVPKYTESESDWDVIGDMGPVLTFNTYNDIFHLFADPMAPGASEADGVGLNGDYEFLVLSKTNDVIILKGKKHAAITIARRLPVEKDWKEYLTQIETLDCSLFGAIFPQLFLQMEDSKYILTEGHTHIFNVVPEEGNPIDDLEYWPFIVTEYGIYLVNPFKSGELSAQQFVLNEDKTALVDVENSLITIIPEPIEDFVTTTPSKYFATLDDLGGEFLTMFNKMADEFKTRYSGRRDLSSIGFRIDDGRFEFILKSAANEATFAVPYEISSGQITILPFDGDNMDEGDMNNNASLFYGAIASIKEMLALIQGTFELSCDEPFSYNTIKYAKSSSDYLVVKR